MSVFEPIVPEGMEIFNVMYDDYYFAPAVRSGDLVIISGQIGFGADGSIPDDISQQVHNTFEMIGRVLESAGLNFSHVVCLDSFHVGDMHEHMEAFIQERAKFIHKPYPAWTAVGVTGLALPEAKVEIKVSARAEP